MNNAKVHSLISHLLQFVHHFYDNAYPFFYIWKLISQKLLTVLGNNSTLQHLDDITEDTNVFSVDN